MDTISKTFLLNLPLYDGIDKIEIGIKKKFKISKDSDHYTFKKKLLFFMEQLLHKGEVHQDQA